MTIEFNLELHLQQLFVLLKDIFGDKLESNTFCKKKDLLVAKEIIPMKTVEGIFGGLSRAAGTLLL